MWILRNHDLMQTQENLCFLLRIKNAVYFYFMCIGILHIGIVCVVVCVCVYIYIYIYVYAHIHTDPCKGVRSSGTGVASRCELPCGCWELKLGPLEEKPMLLTPEPSLLVPLRNMIKV